MDYLYTGYYKFRKNKKVSANQALALMEACNYFGLKDLSFA